MIVFDLAFIRIKQVIRSKEFYFYVIGFPLFFMILFGFISRSWAPAVTTLDIGLYTADNPIVDPITDEMLAMGNLFTSVLSDYKSESGIKIFSTISYAELEKMDTDIRNLVIYGGVEIPSDFSSQASNMTRYYASLILIQQLTAEFENYPSETVNISNAINQLSVYLNSSANLVLNFHGDVTLQDTMQSYTYLWQIMSEFISNHSIIHANSIWTILQQNYSFSFDLNLTSDISSSSSVSFDVQLVSSSTGDAIEDFQREFYSKLLPGNIISTILLSSVSAIWILDQENKTGLLKRLKLTKLSSVQYLGSILLAWSTIAILQGIFMLTFAAMLGFISFSLNPLVWLMMIATMALLGIISATIALIIGSFIQARIAAPILILFGSTLHMFVAEFFITIKPIFSFAGKNFSWLDATPFRSAFLVMKNGIMLESSSEITGLLFDFLLLVIWTIVLFVIGAIIFNKYKLKYAEKE